MELRSIYNCKICGNTIEVVDAYAPPISCCQQEMVKLEEQTEDSSVEKHVPVVEEVDGGIEVTVGSTLHPMLKDHHIVFIEIITENKEVYRQDLTEENEPSAFFPVNKDTVEKVREYCNIHGLWKA